MGRTVPSYRQALEAEIERWKGFRKGLRKRDAEVAVCGLCLYVCPYGTR